MAPAKHQIDHVFAQQHLGSTDFVNLALACVDCNRHKGPNLAGLDSVTAAVVPLFHPRRDRWGDHFRYEGLSIFGLTPTGRATVVALKLNHPRHLKLRGALHAEGTFPFSTTGSP